MNTYQTVLILALASLIQCQYYDPCYQQSYGGYGGYDGYGGMGMYGGGYPYYYRSLLRQPSTLNTQVSSPPKRVTRQISPTQSGQVPDLANWNSNPALTQWFDPQKSPVVEYYTDVSQTNQEAYQNYLNWAKTNQDAYNNVLQKWAESFQQTSQNPWAFLGQNAFNPTQNQNPFDPFNLNANTAKPISSSSIALPSVNSAGLAAPFALKL